MDGEFLVEETAGVAKGIGGGNFIVQGRSLDAALDAARRAVEAVAAVPGTITPFPGGVVRSGSKVGSRYEPLRASTNEAFCPGLMGREPTSLHPDAACCLEIVIDGVDEQAVAAAMAAGIPGEEVEVGPVQLVHQMRHAGAVLVAAVEEQHRPTARAAGVRCAACDRGAWAGLQGRDYSPLCRQLASQGLLVLAPDTGVYDHVTLTHDALANVDAALVASAALLALGALTRVLMRRRSRSGKA
jgi:hypothetical protein